MSDQVENAPTAPRAGSQVPVFSEVFIWLLGVTTLILGVVLFRAGANRFANCEGCTPASYPNELFLILLSSFLSFAGVLLLGAAAITSAWLHKKN